MGANFSQLFQCFPWYISGADEVSFFISIYLHSVVSVPVLVTVMHDGYIFFVVNCNLDHLLCSQTVSYCLLQAVLLYASSMQETIYCNSLNRSTLSDRSFEMFLKHGLIFAERKDSIHLDVLYRKLKPMYLTLTVIYNLFFVQNYVLWPHSNDLSQLESSL